MDSLTIVPFAAPPTQAEATSVPALSVGPDTARLFHHAARPTGQLGTQRPYTVQGDNVMTLVLFACFIIFVLMVARWGHDIVRRAKDFFYSPRNDADLPTAATPFFVFMSLFGCLLMGVASYIYATESLHATFALKPQALVMAVFTLLFIAYLAVKWTAYAVTNSILFDGKKTQQWSRVLLFTTSLEAVLMFPPVMLLVYFDMPATTGAIVFVFVLFLNKILAFFKSWRIFFQQSTRYLQIILYFCALELAPLLALWGAWQMTVKQLEINF